MASSRRRFDAGLLINHVVFGVWLLLILVPLVLLISVSLSSQSGIVERGYRLLPREVTLEAYGYLLSRQSTLLNAYKVSVFVTVVGVGLGVLCISMIGYVLARRYFAWRRVVMLYVLFTMLFHGGLVPTFIVVSRTLGLYDSVWALILPTMVTGWLVFLMRGYMETLPHEIIESAKIDGASEFQIFFRIAAPIAKPGIATIALLSTLKYWNDWFLARLYIESAEKVPLQYWMMRVMDNINFIQSAAANMGIDVGATVEFPSESARMAMVVLAAGPVLFIFPFFQKYFSKGLRIGSLKG